MSDNNKNNKSTKKHKIPKPLKFLRNRSKNQNKQRETREEQRVVDQLPSESLREQQQHSHRDSSVVSWQRTVSSERSVPQDASSTLTQRPLKSKKSSHKIYNPHLSGEILMDQDEYVHIPRHGADNVHSNEEDDKPPSFVHIENPTKLSHKQKSSSPHRTPPKNDFSMIGEPPLSLIRQEQSVLSQSARKSLHRRVPSLSTYQSTSITKHYEVSKQILAAFDSHVCNNLWITAYAVGMQFVETALLEIPKHGYFYSARHERERMENSIEAARVAQQLKDMTQRQHIGDLEIVDKLLKLALEQVEKASTDQDRKNIQKSRQDLESEIRDSSWIVCDSIVLCNETLSSVMEDSNAAVEHPSVFLDKVEQMEPIEARVPDTETVYWSRNPMDPPVVPPPPLVQQSSATSMEEVMLQKALYLSGLEVSEASETAVEDAGPIQESEGRLRFATLADLYHEDFDSLQQSGRVRASFARTYQGRLPESTNGCAVIAPMLCVQHLKSDDDSSFHSHGDPGLTDSNIEETIDVEAPAILQSLRDELGLLEHAFLIPSDAHDYLIGHGKLHQSQFVTVVGGNILDEEHLNAFIQSLDKIQDRKVAATLFFHEHVVTIIKLRRIEHGKVSYWYDFIDSLPLKKMLQRRNETRSELCERLGVYRNMTFPEIAKEHDNVALPMTSRMRCLDAVALNAVIRWYACSKFNEENQKYIDQYPWDETSSDFDPRVFQAFVWGGDSQ